MVNKNSTYLLDFKKNKTSQFGEDGIIEKILEILPKEEDPWCVEFGAWDGLFCSNTNSLITDKGFQAVLIEGDQKKIPDLKKTYEKFSDRVHILHKWVDFDRNSIDTLLNQTDIPSNFTLISLDIDGEDYHIWHSIIEYKPKIVVIEFNLTIPMNIDVIQKRGSGNALGASALALQKLGKDKGYELVSMTDNNMIFVDEHYFPLFEIKDNSCSTLFAPFEQTYITQIYQRYDGGWVLHGNKHLFWYGVNLDLRDEDVQIVPKFIRFFFASKPRYMRALAKAYMLIFRRKNLGKH